MSNLIAWLLLFGYLVTRKPELIISAGLFGLAAEISRIYEFLSVGVIK